MYCITPLLKDSIPIHKTFRWVTVVIVTNTKIIFAQISFFTGIKIYEVNFYLFKTLPLFCFQLGIY